MIIDFAIDNTGNRIMNGFDLALTSSIAQYTIQKVQIKLRTFLGEYFMNNTIGLDYIGTIFKKGVSQFLVDSLVKAQIVAISTVKQITTFQSSFNNQTRLYTITWAAKLINEESTGEQTVTV